MNKAIGKRIIACSTILAFFCVCELSLLPAVDEDSANENSNQVQSIQEGESAAPNAWEKPAGKSPAKMKKFPVLLFLVIVAGIGAGIYFLVFNKKKYTLTVEMGNGVSGTPAAGTYKYRLDRNVNYQYTALDPERYGARLTINDYWQMATGSVMMNGNKIIKVTAAEYDIRGDWYMVYDNGQSHDIRFSGERNSGETSGGIDLFRGRYWVNGSTIQLKFVYANYTTTCHFTSYNTFEGEIDTLEGFHRITASRHSETLK